ncbi:DUF2314 domain-containing protein [Anatilimnocola sp. NA78]|uniref:DUF2314 domain-containing protein n=1 Tax=Anatilimnocola sp. NA78 TaxID=3415683 RepID=UPI003CE52FED
MKWLTRWFDDDVDWYAPAAVLISLYTLYWAIAENRWTIADWPRPMVLAAIFGIVFAICKFLKVPGARWWGIPWVLLLFLAMLINASLNGWTMWSISSVLGVGLMAAGFGVTYFYLSDKDEESAADENDKPFLSLVLLFREQPYLDAAVLARLASKAWGISVTKSSDEDDSAPSDNDNADGDETAFVVGDPPLFMIKHPQAFLIVHHHDQQYFDDSESAAEDMVERRLHHAILEHRAWTAVDVVSWLGPEANSETIAYQLVARLLAELADDNVLAIFDPDAGRMFAYDPETEQKLRGEDPRGELERQYHAPIIAIPDDDPAMMAAVAEAKARWPEFVAAFESRDRNVDHQFNVKGPIGTKGDQEFIWIKVSSIEDKVIFGTLGNDPARVPNLKLGDRVRFEISQLNDWIYLLEGEMIGGFTVKVISEYANRPQEDE